MVYFLEHRYIPFSWKKKQSIKRVIYTILVFWVQMYTQIISEHVISKLKKYCLFLLHLLYFLAHGLSIFKHVYKYTVLKLYIYIEYYLENKDNFSAILHYTYTNLYLKTISI